MLVILASARFLGDNANDRGFAGALVFFYRGILADSDFRVSEPSFSLACVRAHARSWCPFNTMPDDNKPRGLVGARPAKKRRHGIYAGLYYRAGCSQLLGVAFYNVTTDISSRRRVPRVIRSYAAGMIASLALV